ISGGDQALDMLGVAPHVDVHSGYDVLVLEPERDELPALGIAAEDDLVPARRVTRVLHSDVVLVGEEVRDALVGDTPAEHGPCGDPALGERVGPVPDAYASPGEGMQGARPAAR